MEHGLTRFKQGYGFGTKKFGVSSIAKCVKNGVECNKRCVGKDKQLRAVPLLVHSILKSRPSQQWPSTQIHQQLSSSRQIHLLKYL